MKLLCKNCEHYTKKDGFGFATHVCTRDSSLYIDPVLGDEVVVGYIDCYKDRVGEGNNYCGPDAKFFKAKE